MFISLIVKFVLICKFILLKIVQFCLDILYEICCYVEKMFHVKHFIDINRKTCYNNETNRRRF